MQAMTLGWLVATVAVWRVTHLIVNEDGPWDLFVHLRTAAGAIGLGRLVACFLCASVWIAVPFALLLSRGLDLIMLIPALSGGAILLERATEEKETTS
jgi:hypothetical protein